VAPFFALRPRRFPVVCPGQFGGTRVRLLAIHRSIWLPLAPPCARGRFLVFASHIRRSRQPADAFFPSSRVDGRGAALEERRRRTRGASLPTAPHGCPCLPLTICLLGASCGSSAAKTILSLSSLNFATTVFPMNSKSEKGPAEFNPAREREKRERLKEWHATGIAAQSLGHAHTHSCRHQWREAPGDPRRRRRFGVRARLLEHRLPDDAQSSTRKAPEREWDRPSILSVLSAASRICISKSITCRK
jgi:hypothetical protein